MSFSMPLLFLTQCNTVANNETLLRNMLSYLKINSYCFHNATCSCLHFYSTCLNFLPFVYTPTYPLVIAFFIMSILPNFQCLLRNQKASKNFIFHAVKNSTLVYSFPDPLLILFCKNQFLIVLCVQLSSSNAFSATPLS